jgi:hypothetical protein
METPIPNGIIDNPGGTSPIGFYRILSDSRNQGDQMLKLKSSKNFPKSSKKQHFFDQKQQKRRTQSYLKTLH